MIAEDLLVQNNLTISEENSGFQQFAISNFT